MSSCREKLDETLVNMYSNIKYKDYIFYANIIGQCNIIISTDFVNGEAPAGINYSNSKYNLLINPELFNEYNLVNRLAILKHEMEHILNNHIFRQENRDHEKWNYACDAAINQLIDKEHLPSNCILPEYYGPKTKYNQNAEYYYSLDNSNCSNVKHDWNVDSDNLEEQLDRTSSMIDKAIEETVKMKGTIPSNIGEYQKLFSKKSIINWKNELKKFLTKRGNKISTILRTNRRFESREDIRGTKRNKVINLLWIADVSGSVTNKSFRELGSEITNICRLYNTKMTLIQIDTIAYEPEIFDKNKSSLIRKGKGGTVLFPAIEMAKKHNISFDSIIVSTDGYIFRDDAVKFNKLNKNILWLIEKNGKEPDYLNKNKMRTLKLKD